MRKSPKNLVRTLTAISLLAALPVSGWAHEASSDPPTSSATGASQVFAGKIGVGVHGFDPRSCMKYFDAGSERPDRHSWNIPASAGATPMKVKRISVDFEYQSPAVALVRIDSPSGKVLHRACVVDSSVSGDFGPGPFTVVVDLGGGPEVQYRIRVTADLAPSA
ncbi:MAG TPA: hypothetical protein VI818_00870 [Candidatus Thermoplasmatota archaeon]|nr:hypothetical protein [Candidatus Thermoplasmatota archaeon]